MIEKLINWFRKLINWFQKKENDEVELHLPSDSNGKFVLKLDTIEIGYLECQEGTWHFYYSDPFKKMDDLYSIPGFPNLDKEYSSKLLWSFFQTRIPGLGQPLIKEILEKENIDKTNELALLKRFGKKTITNPYTLILI